MKFGLYIHIPHCIQKCHYCDFVTLPLDHSIDPKSYMNLLLEELKRVHHFFPSNIIDTIYFGGGTPSLMPVPLIVTFLEQIGRLGFKIPKQNEITLEVNPGTLSKEDLLVLNEAGVNRFSLGVQTFDQEQLKRCFREHSTDDTINTLNLFKSLKLNFSADVLFTLPHQTKDQCLHDLKTLLTFEPSHISSYILNVPKAHPMAFHRAKDSEQVEMFHSMSELLETQGYRHYEISNFSKPGHESQHNMIYWQGQSYWGLGLSAHSHLHLASKYGDRFWNPTNINRYKSYVEAELSQLTTKDIAPYLLTTRHEQLRAHEFLTDFFHTRLRLTTGIPDTALQDPLICKYESIFQSRLEKLEADGLLEHSRGYWALSKKGQTLSNRAYFELTFLEEDLT